MSTAFATVAVKTDSCLGRSSERAMRPSSVPVYEFAFSQTVDPRKTSTNLETGYVKVSNVPLGQLVLHKLGGECLEKGLGIDSLGHRYQPRSLVGWHFDRRSTNRSASSMSVAIGQPESFIIGNVDVC